MRSNSRLLLAGCCGLALALGACQQPAPAAAPQPKRHSFEESNSNWQPISQPASNPAGAGGNTGTTPQAIKDGWKQVESAKGDAAKQQAAGEMLKRTREMADQSNNSNPH